MESAYLEIGSDGASLTLVDNEGRALAEAFEFTPNGRSWAKSLLREWGYQKVTWRRRGVGDFVADSLE